MKTYKVQVSKDKTEWFDYETGKRHREDGPAVEYPDGTKEWYRNGEKLTEEEFNSRTTATCAGKVVEIEGVKYKLELVND